MTTTRKPLTSQDLPTGIKNPRQMKKNPRHKLEYHRLGVHKETLYCLSEPACEPTTNKPRRLP